MELDQILIYVVKKLVKKIRDADTNKILSMAIVGEKVIYTDTISIRAKYFYPSFLVICF